MYAVHSTDYPCNAIQYIYLTTGMHASTAHAPSVNSSTCPAEHCNVCQCLPASRWTLPILQVSLEMAVNACRALHGQSGMSIAFWVHTCHSVFPRRRRCARWDILSAFTQETGDRSGKSLHAKHRVPRTRYIPATDVHLLSTRNHADLRFHCPGTHATVSIFRNGL